MSLTTLHHKTADLPRTAGPTTAIVRPPGEHEFERADSPTLIAFRESQQLSLLIRATAFVFSDPQSRALQDLIKRIAPSEATALIMGETGTGKELVARHVHALSRRASSNFVAINCGAFSETLIESELFGYERGAFTGAQQAKAGWFETANGGTLFLDEIGDLPLAMQVKLLRVLQEREVVRLGGRKPIPIDVRLIAATNVDLAEAVRAGRFREDLFYRLQVVTLPLKPLRERAGDILPLTRHFLQMYAQRLHVADPVVLPEADQALLAYPWPGNIRELENVIHRALLVCQQGVITAADLHLPSWHTQAVAAPVSVPDVPQAFVQHAAAPETSAPRPHAPAVEGTYAELRQAWQQLLHSDRTIEFENMVLQLAEDAWRHNLCNQVRTAKQLNISRNILRTYLKKSELL
ncbi:sigma 54-interacting transcriptional regulator [Telluria mixta]|uniref:Sigma 54-interacting transcriptional regulator n=1 Tax=Telluria mixta TaxID=34071 RepID=A0ABT2BZ97_9BURK|nr:sigma 54-interacting transcriptional regulator [Telluria mixta]MCS0629911.1 sigma 54-interacting transcriptional regulator [Telluria mixta]WEM96536.1 sigma 54-interacting transcriptional regulator [Telluria mixta]